jgi:protein-S-isoprenylcysteine O-methyltransferase Ste14
MLKLRIWAITALTMAVMALVFLVLMFLSLVDISHGEEDVVAEWAIVKLGLVVVFVLILVTLVCTGLVLKYFKVKEKKERNEPSL